MILLVKSKHPVEKNWRLKVQQYICCRCGIMFILAPTVKVSLFTTRFLCQCVHVHCWQFKPVTWLSKLKKIICWTTSLVTRQQRRHLEVTRLLARVAVIIGFHLEGNFLPKGNFGIKGVEVKKKRDMLFGRDLEWNIVEWNIIVTWKEIEGDFKLF